MKSCIAIPSTSIEKIYLCRKITENGSHYRCIFSRFRAERKARTKQEKSLSYSSKYQDRVRCPPVFTSPPDTSSIEIKSSCLIVTFIKRHFSKLPHVPSARTFSSRLTDFFAENILHCNRWSPSTSRVSHLFYFDIHSKRQENKLAVIY